MTHIFAAHILCKVYIVFYVLICKYCCKALSNNLDQIIFSIQYVILLNIICKVSIVSIYLFAETLGETYVYSFS